MGRSVAAVWLVTLLLCSLLPHGLYGGAAVKEFRDSPVVSASATETAKPLIFAFHGSFASHEAWIGETDRYGFVDEIGNQAIMVMPDALAQ